MWGRAAGSRRRAEGQGPPDADTEAWPGCPFPGGPRRRVALLRGPPGPAPWRCRFTSRFARIWASRMCPASHADGDTSGGRQRPGGGRLEPPGPGKLAPCLRGRSPGSEQPGGAARQGLTGHAATCIMASSPPSGASRFPEMSCLPTSVWNWLELSVSFSTCRKANGGWHSFSLLGHGFFSFSGCVLTKGSTVLSTKDPKPGWACAGGRPRRH